MGQWASCQEWSTSHFALYSPASAKTWDVSPQHPQPLLQRRLPEPHSWLSSRVSTLTIVQNPYFSRSVNLWEPPTPHDSLTTSQGISCFKIYHLVSKVSTSKLTEVSEEWARGKTVLTSTRAQLFELSPSPVGGTECSKLMKKLTKWKVTVLTKIKSDASRSEVFLEELAGAVSYSFTVALVQCELCVPLSRAVPIKPPDTPQLLDDHMSLRVCCVCKGFCSYKSRKSRLNISLWLWVST